MGRNTNMGCSGGDENKNDEVVVEGGGEEIVFAETKIQVFVSADADAPNFLIKMLAHEWMTIGHIQRKVQMILNDFDGFEGECEFVTGIGPVWGDGWDVFAPEDKLWEVDGFEIDNDDQMFAAHTEALGPDAYGGEFSFEVADDWVIVEAYDAFDQFEL